MRRFYIAFPIQDALRPELSWTHYRALMKVTGEAARNFYLEEAVKSGWSSRQLDRQINSFYYQRILASQDKTSVAAEIEALESKPEYEKIIKDPYVLEFLNLPANEHYYESELEQALIDHLQKFMLELGRGYSFVARQKHFNVDGRHFYIDLVFYNYILKCFVLKNRLVMAPMQSLVATDKGQVTDGVLSYYHDRAKSGDIGMVIVEHSFVSPEGRACKRQLSIADVNYPDTDVLKKAREAGLKTLAGESMMYYQQIAAIKERFGITLSKDCFREGQEAVAVAVALRKFYQ